MAAPLVPPLSLEAFSPLFRAEGGSTQTTFRKRKIVLAV